MATTEYRPEAGEDLIKKELITREDLDQARERERKSGTPWYQQLIQMGKITFAAAEDTLRYEWHPKSVRATQQSLGDALAAGNVISPEQLKQALAAQKRSNRLLGNILLEYGFVTREDIARVLARQYDMEFATLASHRSEPAALEAVPESMARRYQLIPLTLEHDKLTVLVSSPQILHRMKDLSVLLGRRIHAMLTAAEDLHAEIGARYNEIREAGTGSDPPAAARRGKRRGSLSESSRTQDKEQTPMATAKPAETKEKTAPANDTRRFEQIAREASGTSVVNMVKTIIEGAVKSGATDIHLDPQDPEMRVRYRIDGVLHDVTSIPENMEPAVVSRVKILADLDITETRHPQDGHISMAVDGREFDVRVATLPTFLGERVVLRLLDQSSILAGIKDLGLESEDEERVTRLIDQPYGMILVTGPTGSGKTTTLYAALNQKNVMTDSIVTLEDPVEYQLSGINQVQIDTDIELTFASTLRAALRQDIDVLLVGEIRDTETARIAIRAAMTGHLVFSTLHTNDAPEAISTLRNMGIPSYLIASAFTAVIGQRLVRTICPQCKTSFTPPPALLRSIGLPTTVKKLWRGTGCEHCYSTGYRGRTGIFEVLEITPELRHVIAADEGPETITKIAKLKTMAMRCREKVKQGVVAPEEFLRVIRT